jgi:Ca2+-binding RTX toxin-like protein
MIIGNQLNGWQDQFQLGGDMLSFFLSDVVRDPSYFQPSSTIVPTYDSHTLVAFSFSAGSGLTVNDLSGHSNNGVLSDPTMWKSLLQQIVSVAIYDTTTGKAVTDTLTQLYTGPVSGIQTQFVDITTDSLNISATAPNCFIHTGTGNDAIALLSGTNVVDGGTGSNFLASGSGIDTFFVDARGAMRDIWNTVSKFHSGDAVTLWGISPSAYVLSWSDGGGAAGYTGLTLHASAAGRPTASITLAGFSQADLTSGRLSTSFGHDAASNSDYLYLRAS